MQVPVSEYRYGTVLKQWLFLPNHLSNLTFRAPSAHPAGAEFTEEADPQGRSMSSFPLGAMARSGFAHMGKPVLPSYFSVSTAAGLNPSTAARNPVHLSRSITDHQRSLSGAF